MNTTAKKKAPAKKQPVKVEKGKAIAKADAVLQLTGKAYNPKKDHNVVAWEKVNQTMKNGKATYGQLCEALKNHHTKEGNHHDFIGYMVHRCQSLEFVK